MKTSSRRRCVFFSLSFRVAVAHGDAALALPSSHAHARLRLGAEPPPQLPRSGRSGLCATQTPPFCRRPTFAAAPPRALRLLPSHHGGRGCRVSSVGRVLRAAGEWGACADEGLSSCRTWATRRVAFVSPPSPPWGSPRTVWWGRAQKTGLEGMIGLTHTHLSFPQPPAAASPTPTTRHHPPPPPLPVPVSRAPPPVALAEAAVQIAAPAVAVAAAPPPADRVGRAAPGVYRPLRRQGAAGRPPRRSR